MYDGNIEYLHGKHIPLFVAALLFAILTLPYAFVLLFIRCLRRRSNTKLLFWVTKLKSLFDAYTGPYKDWYHFWMGLLLLFRNILFLLFIQCLRRQSNFKILFLVTKLKPLFDAYTGPYKDRCHFWTGLMLLLRNICTPSGLQCQ